VTQDTAGPSSVSQAGSRGPTTASMASDGPKRRTGARRRTPSSSGTCPPTEMRIGGFLGTAASWSPEHATAMASQLRACWSGTWKRRRPTSEGARGRLGDACGVVVRV
jgi:hypothetical protein